MNSWGIVAAAFLTLAGTAILGWAYLMALGSYKRSFHNITFPVKRIDGPTQYDHAHIADANGIPLVYVLKRPARGVDGAKLADHIVRILNQHGKN